VKIALFFATICEKLRNVYEYFKVSAGTQTVFRGHEVAKGVHS
jgi:hypothetical protein